MRFQLTRRSLVDGIPGDYDIWGVGEFRDLKTYRRTIDLVSKKKGVTEVVVTYKKSMYDYDGHLTLKPMIYENK